MKKHEPKPIAKLKDNHSYLKANDNTEAKRVAAESQKLPHLQKQPKFMLK